MGNNRYPGVKPFETRDKDLFFGRERDIADLSDLIALERVVVLFGKSGYGKSSLVNAGILPRLAKANGDNPPVVPLLVRLGSFQENRTMTPIENLLLRLQENTNAGPDTAFLEDLFDQHTLWYHFKRRQLHIEQRFLLIFDQFEEFFTYPVFQQYLFKSQLSELLYTETPQALRDQSANLNKEQRLLLAQPMEIKSLFVIRADRMSLLDSMKDKLPAILHKCHEIKGLSEPQAREAIIKPALADGGPFRSKKFSYSEDALQKILGELSKASRGTRSAVEAFQLQILCQYIENLVIDRDVEHIEIHETDLPDIANIYEAYYKGQIKKLHPDLRLTAQRLIEEGLLLEDSLSGDARRLSMDAGVLAQQFGATPELLSELENTFLLRREANALGGFNYEICHDTLIAPIRRAKAMRKSLEERLESEARRHEAERKALEERAKRELAERQRRNARWLASAAILGLVLALLAMTWAINSQRKAQTNLELYREEQQKRKAGEAKKLIEQARTDLNAQQYFFARQKLDSAKVLDPKNPDIYELKQMILQK